MKNPYLKCTAYPNCTSRRVCQNKSYGKL